MDKVEDMAVTGIQVILAHLTQVAAAAGQHIPVGMEVTAGQGLLIL